MNILIKICLSMLTVLSLSKAWAIPPAAIAGIWLHDGKQTSIQPGNNYNFIFCNEQNDCTDGIIHSGGVVSVNRWNVTGKLNSRGNVIAWNNGTQWVKAPVAKIQFGGRLRKLNGPWLHDGKPTSITLSADGRHFTMTNEVGSSDTGYLDKHQNLVIPTLNIVGRVSNHGNRIEWSNGTTWYKR